MIRYSKEEFPPRFSVFEHTCKYCGTKFYSNRSRSSYDTPTCRVYDGNRKKLNQPITKKPVVVEFIDFDKHPILAGDIFNKYFPELLYREIYDDMLIKTGGNDKYYFQVVDKNMVKENKDKYPKVGVVIYSK